MPLFISEEELRQLSTDPGAIAERADAAIRDLRRQLDTTRAEADAAAIAAEQTCALLEQKYTALSTEFSRLQAENIQFAAAAEKRLADLADAQSQKHHLHLKAIGKDGDIERLSIEAAELHRSKRQLLELLEQKDAEIGEKNATIQSYLDKIVNLTDRITSKEATIHDNEAELARCRATCNRLTQEKELFEKHNAWLNEELTAKVNNINELRKSHMDIEVDMSAKLADLERQFNESSASSKKSKQRARELEQRVSSLEEELRSSKDAAGANEERFTAELTTVSKLVELYKASSEEWSRKAGDLEGVIKALETHLTQVENDYKEKLEKETSLRKEIEKEALELKEKLDKCELEIERARKANELSIIPVYNFQVDANVEELSTGGFGSDTRSDRMLVPRIPEGISGTALAASLLRDGWSLAKMYEKYNEAADAMRHEKWGRKHSEAILERVLHEIEEKADIILEERAEHERIIEAYTLMDQKLQQALLEHDNYESVIRKLKSELKKSERSHTIAEKEINDLQKQVTILLKECQDVQVQCGAVPQAYSDHASSPYYAIDDSDVDKVISEHLLTFKDIKGLVEQNVQLRSLVRNLSRQEEEKDAELRVCFQIDLQKITDEATAKVEAVLKRSEEQGRMIESLHSSVAMYKRLYEEERRHRGSAEPLFESASGFAEDRKKELMVLFEGSQEASKKAHNQLSEHAKSLEEELSRMRNELTLLRLERDKMVLEANFAKERLDSFMKEFEVQRQEAHAVSARNVELTHLLVGHQKRLRESSDSLKSCEENSRKLSMEVSLLKHEREILTNSEKRASDEIQSLSERECIIAFIFCLASLDTIHSTNEVHENARDLERKKLEEYLKRVERDWAEAKKELQEERDHARALSLEKEKAVDSSMKQVDDIRKELTDAWRAVASADARAAVAEARCSDMEPKSSSFQRKTTGKIGNHDQSMVSTDEAIGELWKAKEEIEKLKEEVQANKDYMLQYKEIAHTNEVALKQIESAHEEYKLEAERRKKALEAEVHSLRNELSNLESRYISKSEEAACAIEAKEKELFLVLTETSGLKDELSEKMRQIGAMEIQISSLKDDLEKEQKHWRSAQDKYERQVILQSETIQELTSTSRELSLLQGEVSKLRETSESQKIENELLKSTWQKEKSVLEELRNEAERKYGEINEQNRILHNRLESLHVKLAEKEHNSAGYLSHDTDSHGDSDLQNVISYLRRTKEIKETEISLLKQEKLRLQSQLESATKAAETAQTLLRSEHENSRSAMLKDEEFKALQLQVRELSLLRESNMQLRVENEHNFEEGQKYREEAQRAKMDAENCNNLLKEKEIELEACQKEIQMQSVEIGYLKDRIAELVESSKIVDVAEYEQMKDELQVAKAQLAEVEMQLQLTKNLVSEKQESISNLENDLSNCRRELAEQEKKLNSTLQAYENIKSEAEKQKKVISVIKKKNEPLMKEKEELSKENQSLLKQLEDLRSSRRGLTENLSEQARKEKEEKDKEKDARIQILEKTLERERDDLRKERDDSKKEKSRRVKTEKLVIDLIQNVNKEKKKVEEELLKHKNATSVVLENAGITASQLPSGSTLDELTSSLQ